MSGPGLPAGWAERRNFLALNVKIGRGATAEELRDVGNDVLGPGWGARGETAPLPSGERLAWPAWWEALTESASRADSEYRFALEGLVLESALESANELARELWGPGARVSTDGRSGGWLVLEGRGAPDADEARAVVESGESEDDAGETLAKLETFRAACDAAVADFPRSIAWTICANGFLPALETARRADEWRGILQREAIASCELLETARTVAKRMQPATFDVVMVQALSADLSEAVARLDAANKERRAFGVPNESTEGGAK